MGGAATAVRRLVSEPTVTEPGRREREVTGRVALGAKPNEVRRLVVGAAFVAGRLATRRAALMSRAGVLREQ